MVVSSQKFLPSGKSGSLAVRPTAKLSMIRKPLVATSSDGEAQKTVLDVRNKVTSLTFIFKRKKILKKKILDRKRKLVETEKNKKREEELESKRKKGGKKDDEKLLITPPGGNIIDSLTRFAGFTLLGFIVDKYSKFFPKLIEFGKTIQPAIEIFSSFAKNLVGGTIDFIENGYKAYDKVRAGIKNIGGEGAQKTFDEFSKNLNLILNGAIMASMLIASTAPGKKSGGVSRGGGYGAGYAAGYAAGLASRGRGPRYRSPGQAAAGGTFQENLSRQALSRERMLADAGPRGPLDRMRRGFRGAGAQLQTGTLFQRGSGLQKALYNAPGKLKGVTSSLGKVGSVGGRIFGRIPIIGGLIDFAINLAMGEDPGRAAAKAVGATVGSALGTFIPVPFAGTILGGILGDIVGGAMYDTLVGSKIKPQAKAQGGTVTSGQSRVSPTRRIKKTKTKQRKVYVPQKTQPGKDFGGKLKIEQLYGEDKPGEKSALRALKKSSEDLKKMKSMHGIVGGILGAGIDMALGQKPDKKLANSLGSMFGSVIEASVNAELNSSFNDISKAIAMASGGVVPSREIGARMSVGERIGKYISNAFSIALESSATRVLQNLNQEVNREGGSTLDGDGGAPRRGGGGSKGLWQGEAASIPPEGKALLDAIAGSESSGYNSRYPSKAFSGYDDHPRIDERILSGPNKGLTSNAAGRYQFLSTTWDQYKRPGAKFTPEEQDIAAYRLAIAAYGYGEQGLLKALREDPTKVANKLSKTWTSLPGGIEPNNATGGFLSRFNTKVKEYKLEPAKPAAAKPEPVKGQKVSYNGLNQQTSYELAIHERNVFLYQQETVLA